MSEWNYLGFYLLISIGFVVFALIEFAVIVVIHRRSTKKGTLSKIKQDQGSNNKISFKRPNDEFSLTPLSLNIRGSAKIIDSNEETNPMIEESGKCTLSISSIQAIDLGAFIFHFTAFLLFNFLYWNKYLEHIILGI